MSISSLCSSGMPTVSNNAPKVLFVATSRNDGGLERYSVQMAARLAASGGNIRFACAPGEIVETLCRAAGVETLPLTTRNSADWHCAGTLAAQIVEHSIAIVHVHSRRDYVTATLGVAEARRQLRTSGRRPKLILHAHMRRPLGAPLGLSGRFFRWGADQVFANSHTVRQLLMESHHLPQTFVRLLHNGVDLERFAAPGSPEAVAQRAQMRRAWDIPEAAPVLGMIGRLDAKGQHTLLEVVPELVRKHAALRIVLVGSEGLPGESARLTAQAEAGGFAEKLLLTGPREDVPALLPAFDVLVHLPTDESFGLALTEAMAAGLPTIATDIGGCREVVQNGVTGLLVAPGDSTALVQAVESLLDREWGTARRAELGGAGRRSVETQFSLEQQIEHLQHFYQELDTAQSASEAFGTSRLVKRTRWTAAGMVLAAIASGLFAHSPAKHPAPHRTRHVRFSVVAMKSHLPHPGKSVSLR